MSVKKAKTEIPWPRICAPCGHDAFCPRCCLTPTFLGFGVVQEVHNAMLALLLTDDNERRVPATDWLSAFELDIIGFQQILLLYLETQDAFVDQHESILHRLGEGEYQSVLHPLERLCVLNYLKEQLFTTKSIREFIDTTQDRLKQVRQDIRRYTSEQLEIAKNARLDSVHKMCEDLYNLIKNADDPEEDDRKLSEVFEELPDSKDLSDYYKV